MAREGRFAVDQRKSWLRKVDVDGVHCSDGEKPME